MKILKYFGVTAGILLLPVIILTIVYLIDPDFVRNKAIDYFQPTVNIGKSSNEEITVEVPQFYELMQIACSLTPTFQNDANLLDTGKNYYNEFMDHFGKYKNHELISELEKYLSAQPYGITQIAIRLLSLNYELDDKGNVKEKYYLNINPLILRMFKSDVFLIPYNIRLIDDFAKTSNFAGFFKNHATYYNKLISNYYKLCDFENMKKWLESKFPARYQSYRIIFSPLTGGFHNTMNLKNKNGTASQTLMFVQAPFENIDGLNKKSFEIAASRIARVVFTEIDHNYVNPLTDKYRAKLESSMTNLEKWNAKTNGGYNSEYETFNEYMTWGVFSLYAMDTYSQNNLDTIVTIQENMMTNYRKFVKFKEFNRELMKLYEQNGKPQIEILYGSILEWIKENS